jgi:hypothetical protein
VTASATQALARFAQLNGVTETPHGSNHVPGITDFLHTAGGVTTGNGPWCCETVSRVLFDVGIHDLCDPAKFGGWINGAAYVPYVTRAFRGGARWHTTGAPGDLGICVWGGAGSNPNGDHIVMIAARNADGSYRTWEGNAAGGGGFDQVAEHTRPASVFLGFVRPSYGAAQKPAPPRPAPIVAPHPVAGEPPYRRALFLTSPHLLAGADVVAWQRRMLARGWRSIGRVDGVFGERCSAVAGQFQDDCNHHRWAVGPKDCIVGPRTWHATWARPVN